MYYKIKAMLIFNDCDCDIACIHQFKYKQLILSNLFQLKTIIRCQTVKVLGVWSHRELIFLVLRF